MVDTIDAKSGLLTQSEEMLALVVNLNLSQVFIHTQVDQTIFCFHILDKITFLIYQK